MAKKNMDILLGNILGKAAIHPQDRFGQVSWGLEGRTKMKLKALRQRAIRPMMNHGDISPLSAQRKSLTRFRASPERKVSPSARSWNTS